MLIGLELHAVRIVGAATVTLCAVQNDGPEALPLCQPAKMESQKKQRRRRTVVKRKQRINSLSALASHRGSCFVVLVGLEGCACTVRDWDAKASCGAGRGQRKTNAAIENSAKTTQSLKGQPQCKMRAALRRARFGPKMRGTTLEAGSATRLKVEPFYQLKGLVFLDNASSIRKRIPSTWL